jgi:gliding motility-associated-like protein
MKNIIYILALFLMLISTASFAQVQITRQVIGSTGGDVTGSNISVSFTVGETVIQTISNSMILTQGFQQPEDDSELGDSLIFYSGITPNGDGVNDVWIIDNIEKYPENTVQIFNRWGNKIYDEEGYNNQDKAWPSENNGAALNGGNSQASDLANSTYFYVVVVEGKTFKGWIELTR